MKKAKYLLLLIPSLIFAQTESKTDSTYHSKMEWFKDAKLGIFIHWGIYAVNGISESWSFYNGYISHQDYLKQTDGFTADNYDPEYWAGLIKQSGAKYSVITSKHHDGFALWDTKKSDFSAARGSAAGKDVLTPFVTALRENDLKVGLYYSLPDWSYKDYTDHTQKVKRYEILNEPKRWKTFLEYYQGQLIELQNSYDPDLWWFDGDWEHNAEEWEILKVKSMLLEKNPHVIFNSRLCGNGDYETPEIGLPVLRPQAKYWELCMTMNDSWGYQPNDNNYKSPQQVIDIFVDCISKGGNLLLDIGPKADGTIPIEQENILKELGKWTAKHSEAIYSAQKGIPYDHFYGPTSLSKDSTTLYLYVRDKPSDGQVVLKGISNKINRIFVVGNGTLLEHKVISKVYWSKYPGITYIKIPEPVFDDYWTVLAVVLDGKIDLYREKN
jgi:alpha-L-fucosidase